MIAFFVSDGDTSELMVGMLPFFCSTLYLTICKDVLIGVIIG